MRHTYEEVRQFAEELPEDQRILLANWLWESTFSGDDEPDDAVADAAWDAEIGRRVEEIKAGNVRTYSREEAEAELRSMIRR